MTRRIVVADDHLVVRQGLRMILESAGYEIVGEAADGEEALRICLKLKPDVAILDLEMPHLSGTDCARVIGRLAPEIATIILTMHDDERYLSAALRAGVSGYVLKSQPADDLLKAIEAASRGRVHLGSSASRAAIRDSLRLGATRDETLTTREREVLNLVAEGNATKEIATVLGISVKTAESHRMRVMKKLDVHNTAGLVRYAIREGLAFP